MDHFHGLLGVSSVGIMKTWQGSGEDGEREAGEEREVYCVELYRRQHPPFGGLSRCSSPLDSVGNHLL